MDKSPKTDIPSDRERFYPRDDEFEFIGADAVAAALDENKLVDSANCSGIPHSWKTENGYRCALMQYGMVTEDITYATAAEAAEWFEEMFMATE